METKELLKKVKEIELKTRGLTKQVFSGEYHSAFKGRGMTFSEVKNYQFGDDVRSIDWNVTARFNEPFVKVFEEERELSVFLVLDISGSNNFGTRLKSKKELMLEVAAVLAFSAVANNDKIGAIFTTDQVEKYIPPKKGRSHALMILRELILFKPKHTRTQLDIGLKFFRNIVKKRSICFVISDFYDENDFYDALKIANRKHDMVALRLYDPAEKELPNLGLIKMFDAEQGVVKWVNTGSKKVRDNYTEQYEESQQKLHDIFRRSGVDYASLSTEGKYLMELNKLFLTRSR
ncbi:DUF58 domain-containing protein [Brumimicrobium salinarum]|uniref:DUF58 domain-containing protein n=1 Tax=Brumimicrobium salinarum TaxID=2058658 RepID=A0A2I0R4E8_9FLAO|nr:DUF58 domain-containing protein [Brumimicrobium salinarum]PKR81438.1 DUF58 domain-containing protein [Brumimicrobium salinarum]